MCSIIIFLVLMYSIPTPQGLITITNIIANMAIGTITSLTDDGVLITHFEIDLNTMALENINHSHLVR